MLRKHILFIILLALGIASCAEKGKDGKVLDTPTTGTLKIMVDDGYKPVIESCIDVFDSIYRLAKIVPTYTSEGEAFAALVRDSVQMIIVSRRLTQKELDYFQSRGFKPPVTPIAYDAIAFLFNPQNVDSVFTVAQIRDILTGKITKWAQINPKSKLGELQLVFDNPLSGTVRYVKDSIIAGAELSPNASALQTNEEVISYVSKNKSALGIISANWISDTDDKGVQKFLREIRIADIATEPGKTAYGPYQAYLARGWYPFKRTVYVINAQGRKGLGLGFSSYLAGDGQRIMLKDGLLPANAVTRLIQVSKE
jgi:phosphate transport system substrate-binding protein